MKNYSCIIVEDEFPAIELLKRYLGNFSNWHIEAVFTDPIEANNFLASNHIDVLFLDIQLPKLTGMELLNTIQKPPFVVITSAYPEHAVKAFELTAFDYLLKPYSFQRFVQTINRIQQQEQQKKEPEKFIIVTENRQQIKLSHEDITYAESLREYVMIYHANGAVKTKMSIGKLSEILEPEAFIRIHRSFIVAKRRISAFTTQNVTVDGHQLPIGRFYKKAALEVIASENS